MCGIVLWSMAYHSNTCSLNYFEMCIYIPSFSCNEPGFDLGSTSFLLGLSWTGKQWSEKLGRNCPIIWPHPTINIRRRSWGKRSLWDLNCSWININRSAKMFSSNSGWTLNNTFDYFLTTNRPWWLKSLMTWIWVRYNDCLLRHHLQPLMVWSFMDLLLLL